MNVSTLTHLTRMPERRAHDLFETGELSMTPTADQARLEGAAGNYEWFGRHVRAQYRLMRAGRRGGTPPSDKTKVQRRRAVAAGQRNGLAVTFTR